MSNADRNHELFGRLKVAGLTVGVLGAAGTAIGAWLDATAFFQTYLFAFVFWLSLPLGGLFFLMIQHIVRGRWGAILRRQLEAAAATIPLFALLFVPLALGTEVLYEWARPEVVADDPVLQHKSLYLNVPAWLVRAGVYFVAWTALAWFLRRWSIKEDADGPSQRSRSRLRRLGAAGLIVLTLTATFAAIDWVQSLEPHWYSSIYPLMVIVGQMLTAIVLFNLLTLQLSRSEPLEAVVDADRLNDLGNILLVFVVLWGYTEFVQLAIIWAGDTSHKIPWYLARSQGGWEWLIVAVVVLQFFVPLLALFFRKSKRTRGIFMGLAAVIFALRFVDVYWLVIPAFHEHTLWVSWQALAAWLGIGGFWLAAFAWLAGRQPLLARSSAELFEEGS